MKLSLETFRFTDNGKYIYKYQEENSFIDG